MEDLVWPWRHVAWEETWHDILPSGDFCLVLLAGKLAFRNPEMKSCNLVADLLRGTLDTLLCWSLGTRQ